MADVAGLEINNPIVVARTQDDRRQVVAQHEDIKAGNFNGPAQVRTFSSEDKGVAEYGKVMGLQAILKFTIGWEMLEQGQALAEAEGR